MNSNLSILTREIIKVKLIDNFLFKKEAVSEEEDKEEIFD